MLLSELLGKEVVDESGRKLGRVHDLRGELVGRRLHIVGLVPAGGGVLERYGIGTGGSGGPESAKVHGHAVIPWSAVLRVGPQVVVRG